MQFLTFFDISQNDCIYLKFKISWNFLKSLINTHWKKLSHFDLKSWVTGGSKSRPGIPSDLIQIFLNYLESRVWFYFRQWLNFLGQNDSFFLSMQFFCPVCTKNFKITNLFYFFSCNHSTLSSMQLMVFIALCDKFIAFLLDIALSYR